MINALFQSQSRNITNKLVENGALVGFEPVTCELINKLSKANRFQLEEDCRFGWCRKAKHDRDDGDELCFDILRLTHFFSALKSRSERRYVLNAKSKVIPEDRTPYQSIMVGALWTYESRSGLETLITKGPITSDVIVMVSNKVIIKITFGRKTGDASFSLLMWFCFVAYGCTII